jgi:hypothetical protein
MVGVFGVAADPSGGGLWRVKVWEEHSDKVEVSTDMVRCNPSTPMRVTGNGRQLILRELNPGGMITPSNRLDHLIWWAVCSPAHAGQDPSGLGSLARQLGYSGTLQERQQVLPAPPR